MFLGDGMWKPLPVRFCVVGRVFICVFSIYCVTRVLLITTVGLSTIVVMHASNHLLLMLITIILKLCIPISHYRLLASKILIKNRVDRRTSGFESILVKIETVEDSVMKPV